MTRMFAIAVALLALSLDASPAYGAGGPPAPAENPATPAESGFKAHRLIDAPIIFPALHASIGPNIQGPSLIRVPSWVDQPLGRYYLYFADHKGKYIRLAYADRLEGPWHIHAAGALHLHQTPFAQQPPAPTPEEQRRFDELVAQWTWAHDLKLEATEPHIASPEVRVDEATQRIVMYYHGLESFGRQASRVAVSRDGINFESHTELLTDRTYLRVFNHDGYVYAMGMPGQLYRSRDALSGFEVGPRVFGLNQRHFAFLKRDDTLHVFWTEVGDAPEVIKVSTIDLSGDWTAWKASEPREVLRPERAWEGANAPVEPSVRSTAYGLVNQLRDPAIYEEDDKVYLLYAVGGESGIAIARLELPEKR